MPGLFRYSGEKRSGEERRKEESKKEQRIALHHNADRLTVFLWKSRVREAMLDSTSM